MNAQSLYEFLYDWASPIVSPLQVIRAYQNAAKPSVAYMAIEDDQSWQPFGRADNYAGHVNRTIHNYTATPVFWDVGGFGDSLRTILENLDLLTTKQLFLANGIGILKKGQIMTMPWLSPEHEFVREHRLEITFAVAREQTDPGMTNIETVELINNIGALV